MCQLCYSPYGYSLEENVFVCDEKAHLSSPVSEGVHVCRGKFGFVANGVSSYLTLTFNGVLTAWAALLKNVFHVSKV